MKKRRKREIRKRRRKKNAEDLVFTQPVFKQANCLIKLSASVTNGNKQPSGASLPKEFLQFCLCRFILRPSVNIALLHELLQPRC